MKNYFIMRKQLLLLMVNIDQRCKGFPNDAVIAAFSFFEFLLIRGV